MLARSIHELAKLKEDSDNFEINAIATLKPYINSDSHITNKDIYISWYAHTYSIYKDTKISTKEKLKFAQLSSHTSEILEVGRLGYRVFTADIANTGRHELQVGDTIG